MSAFTRGSGTTDRTPDPDRIGTIRRYTYSIAISLVHEDEDGGGRIFSLATLPGSGDAVLGEIVCQDGQASPLWEEEAERIGVLDGSMFALGLIRAVLALDAARDGTEIDLEAHGLRLNRVCRFFVPTVQETDA